MSNRSSFQLSKKYELIQPGTEKAYPIFVIDWEFLKKRIRQIPKGPVRIHGIKNALAGAIIPSIIGILATDFSTLSSDNIPWTLVALGIILIASSTGAIITRVWGADMSSLREVSVDNVIEEMERLEVRGEKKVQDLTGAVRELIRERALNR